MGSLGPEKARHAVDWPTRPLAIAEMKAGAAAPSKQAAPVQGPFPGRVSRLWVACRYRRAAVVPKNRARFTVSPSARAFVLMFAK